MQFPGPVRTKLVSFQSFLAVIAEVHLVTTIRTTRAGAATTPIIETLRPAQNDRINLVKKKWIKALLSY